MNLNSKVELMLIPALAEMNLVFLDETPIFILDFFEVNENLKYCWMNVYAGGKDLRANLETTLYFMHEGEFLSDYDYHIGSTLALVLSGGDLDTPAWMDEQYFLDLERESILSLLGEEKTQARIRHMLSTGKPLAN
jgi:hypothetical protein